MRVSGCTVYGFRLGPSPSLQQSDRACGAFGTGFRLHKNNHLRVLGCRVSGFSVCGFMTEGFGVLGFRF